jgi:hypothetical protein
MSASLQEMRENRENPRLCQRATLSCCAYAQLAVGEGLPLPGSTPRAQRLCERITNCFPVKCDV